MLKGEKNSIYAVISLAVFLFIGGYLNLYSLETIFSYFPYFIIAAMIAVLGIGFRKRIEKLFGEKDSLSIEQKGKAVSSERQPIQTAIPTIPKPDPAYEHLHAHLFWESWRYFPLAIRLGAKNGRKHLPGTKLIVNLHTRKAYQISSYIGSQILSGKIQYHDRRKIFPNSELGKWAEQNGYTFYDRIPTDEELQPVIRKSNEEANSNLSQDSGKEQDKSEQESKGFGIPISLSELSLITDKLTYKVGDTIRASVKVLSLSLGTTTVRLISPSGRQLAIKTSNSHFSGTFTFDLGMVEQSWEKGIWKVIAKRGTMYDEQEIKIL